MKYLSFSLLGLAFVPACLSADKQCFSEKLDPPYPCCTGNTVVLTDESGDWGVENGQWCGIGGASSNSCFATTFGYPCCTGNKVVYSDARGKWGKENGKWCGIDDNDGSSDSCFSVALGYPCCIGNKVLYTDESGKWGVENDQWCGIKDNSNPYEPTEYIENFDFQFLTLENYKKNMVYSPLSIKYALKMLLEGADGNTYTELKRLVGNESLTKYTTFNENISLANGLFIKNNFYNYVRQEFINTLEEKYNADVVEDSFTSASNANNWIASKTLGMIQNMLDDKAVKQSVMLIMNALAIDLEWIRAFQPSSTERKVFYLENGGELSAATMIKKEERSSSISYYLDDSITVLTMDSKDYGRVQFEFMAIMPKEEKLSQYIKTMTKEKIAIIDRNLKESYTTQDGLNIYLPKFKFKYDLKLKQDLLDLGVKDIFDKYDADFSKMVDLKEDYESVFVSDALHRAVVEVAEKGVKAAGATVIIATAAPAKALPRQKHPIDIVIDKPFMFVIRDKETKDIWFVGTVYEPTKY